MVDGPSIPSLMIAVVLAPTLLAGCLGDDLPELPDQLRVRDADLPGLTMYLNVTEEDGRFRVYAVTVNEGDQTYYISRTANQGEVAQRAPWLSAVRDTNETLEASPGIHLESDAIGLEYHEFEPGHSEIFQERWPRLGQQALDGSRLYLWEVGFHAAFEIRGESADLSVTLPLDPADTDDGNETGKNEAEGEDARDLR